MTHIRTQILPSKQSFAKIRAPHELNLKAISIYLATGFFLDTDTFFKDEVCLLPAHDHKLDDQGFLIESKPWFEWYYDPRPLSFQQALDEYIEILTLIMKDQLRDSQVILPLSGGLDSRSQALVLKGMKNEVHAYSYAFQGGYPEHKISAKVAKACGFQFEKFDIPYGYLWDCIEELADINKCFSEFSHPRQMAILNDFKRMNGVFSLGHWGDVLYDRGVPEGTKEEDIIPLLFKKMIKPDGLILAKKLWEIWGITGDFDAYLTQRLEELLSKIKIDNVSAKVRAFKTTHWAHRWTSTNLSIFETAHPITLPYYDDRMCEFICRIPEEYLADRKLQLAHLRTDKDLASITWHDQKPFNLNNYKYNKTPYNLPYRIISKLKREFMGLIGRPFIQRNFELQFLGDENDKHLRKYLFDESFFDLVPKPVVDDVYHNFKRIDYVKNSHSLSMLLTLSMWNKKFNKAE